MLQNNLGYFNLDMIAYTTLIVKHLENDFANIRINKEFWCGLKCLKLFFSIKGELC